MTEAALAPLTEELQRWRAAGRRALLWWRDDDVIGPGARLARLLATARRFDLPLLMSVIPEPLVPGLAAALREFPRAWLCQHGFAHTNHEPAGRPPAEFGPARVLAEAVGDIARGRDLLAAKLPASRLLPVFVAPWHQLRPDIAAALAGLGFKGLADFGPTPPTMPGLVCRNIRIDVLNWAEPGPDDVPLRPLAWIAATMADALGAMRGRPDDAFQPFGLLTHHRAMSDATWDQLSPLFACLQGSEAVTFADPPELFGIQVAAPNSPRHGWDPLAELPHLFGAAGSVAQPHCPLCSGQRTGLLWRVPLLALPPGQTLHAPGTPNHLLAVRHLPGTELPQKLFCFDICAACETVFRNPRDPATTLAPTEAALAAARPAAALAAQALLRALPAETRLVVDADCRSGALLEALAPLLPERRLVGLGTAAGEAAGFPVLPRAEVPGPTLAESSADAVLLTDGLPPGEDGLVLLARLGAAVASRRKAAAQPGLSRPRRAAVAAPARADAVQPADARFRRPVAGLAAGGGTGERPYDAAGARETVIGRGDLEELSCWFRVSASAMDSASGRP